MISLKVLALVVVVLHVEVQGESRRSEYDFPHHVMVGSCGGSIIDKQWVLTSRSCTELNDEEIRLIFGAEGNTNDEDWSDDPARSFFTLSVNSGNIFPHRNLDAALIKLPVNLELNQNVKNIKLYSKATSNVKLDQHSIGVVPDQNPRKYGEMLNYGKYVLSPYFNGYCKNYEKSFMGESKQICTVNEVMRVKPLCKSDLGSGLIVGWNQDPYLFGIHSEKTCMMNTQIYTRVETLIPWIQKVIN